MKLLREKELFAGCRSSLSLYAIAQHKGYDLARHILSVIALLEDVERGLNDRLAISFSPRHGKSRVLQLFMAWYLGKHPSESIILATYSEQLAEDVGRRVLQLVQSSVHQSVFPDCQLARDFGGSGHFATVKGGEFFALGRAGSITGRGASLLCIDDIYRDSSEAGSVAIRKQVLDFWETVALTRLSSDGRIVLCGTRWHEADLFSHVLGQSEAA